MATAVARMRDSDVQKPPGVAEAIDWLAALTVLGIERLDEAAIDRTLGSVLKYPEDQELVRAAGLATLVSGGATAVTEFSVETIQLDLPAVVGALQPAAPRRGRADDRRARARLRAGADAGQADLAAAAVLDRARGVRLRPLPGTGVRLGVLRRCSARAGSTRTQARRPAVGPVAARRAGAAPTTRPFGSARCRWARARPPRRPAVTARETSREREVPFALRASDEEVLRDKRFDALEPDELAQLYRLMTRLRIATPLRRTRRARRDRHGERIDMRRTLRQSMRTGGDPIRLARRRRRVVRRRTGDAVRHLGVDGALRARVSAVPDAAQRAAGRGAPRRSCSRRGSPG